MTFTKQSRFLPGIGGVNLENAELLSFQLKTGHSTVDEMNDSLNSIQCGLSNLYTKLLKLNAALIMQNQQEKGGNKYENEIQTDSYGDRPDGGCSGGNLSGADEQGYKYQHGIEHCRRGIPE